MRNAHIILSFMSLFLLLFLLFSFAGCSANIQTHDVNFQNESKDQSKDLSSSVCYKDNCFSVEIPSTTELMAIGLMNRKSMDDDKGMLFVYGEEGIYSFWMKNMSFDIDIIWIDSSYKVVEISSNTPFCVEDPCKIYTPKAKAQYVLEINAGLSDKLGIKKGTFLNINN